MVISVTGRVIAISDISKPQKQSTQTQDGQGTARILDADEEEQVRPDDPPPKHCYKLVLQPEGTNSLDMIIAIELVPLPYAAAQLLNARLAIREAEESHGILLLTPTNTRIVAPEGEPVPTDMLMVNEEEFSLSFDEMVLQEDHDVIIIE